MPLLLAALLALFPLAPPANPPAPAPPAPCPQVAAGAPALPAVNATSWVVADMDTGEVLVSCQPHNQYAPASVLKLLTALSVQPKLKPEQPITVTHEDLIMDPASSRMGEVPGGTYSAETLLLGLILNSGNDAAQTLARAAGGNTGMPGTIAHMNELAVQIGAKNTHAVNPHGLDAPGQVTTAFDLAIIARETWKNPQLARYMSTTTAEVPAQPTYPGYQIQSDNQLLYNYPGALGGKTGFTDEARHTYVGAAQRGNRRLVVTLMHGERLPTPLWEQAVGLLDWGFAVPAHTKGVESLNVKPPAPVEAAPKEESAPKEKVGNEGRQAISRKGGADTPTAAFLLGPVAVVAMTFGAIGVLHRTRYRPER